MVLVCGCWWRHCCWCSPYGAGTVGTVGVDAVGLGVLLTSVWVVLVAGLARMLAVSLTVPLLVPVF